MPWRSAQSFFRQRLDQENRVLGERFAKNQQMPELNFIGSIGLSGLAALPPQSYSPQPQWGVCRYRVSCRMGRAPAPTKEGMALP